MAGETIMDGFVGIKIPLTLRRLVTMAPGMAIICLGINPMKALVISQVTLSFALPFAIIPMLLIAGRRDIMGALVNKLLTKAVGWVIATMIICFNAVLLYLTFTGKV
jgi:manganese transport protein